MEVLSYVLKASFLLAFLFVVYLATTAYFPCTSYPSAYLQAREVGEQISKFRMKNSRLPDFSNQTDVSELALSTGHLIEPISDADSYVLHISPETARNFTYSVNQATQFGFDFPWVIYNPASGSITCGHR